MAAGTLTFAKPTHREYVERLAGLGFGKRLNALLRNRQPDAAEIAAVKAQFVQVATAADVNAVTGALTSRKGAPSRELTVAMLEALRDFGSRGQPAKMGRTMLGLNKLLRRGDEEITVLIAENLGVWSPPGATEALLPLLKSKKHGAAVRRAAATAIALAGFTENVETLAALAAEGDTAIRYAALVGLAQADLDLGVEAAAKLFADDPGYADPVPALQAVLRDRQGAKRLGEKLAGATLHPEVVAQVAAFHRQTGQLPKKIADLFANPTGGGGSLSAQLLAENPQALVADVIEKGDPHRGEVIYRRKALACTSCHAIGPVGPEIGPNLVAVGAAASPEYMVESILKPNAAIAEHYENRLFTLKDGTVQMGVVTFKSEKEVVVRDSAQAGREIRIPAAEIQREQGLPSLMPAGLADQLADRGEFLDLAKFLAVLGHPGEFANDERPLIRRWSVAAAGDGERAWTTVYSKVNGELPAEDLPAGGRTVIRGEIEVQVAGEAQFEINDATGARGFD